MLFATSLLLQAVASLAVGESLRGVPDELLYLYQPLPSDSSKWACLGDPSVILNLSQINDDYCDCPDGSDEPGTSACGSKSRFFCQNKGFAPRYISGSKVNDGVCDCCDCSDEEPDRSALWVDYQSCEQLYKEFERLVAEELDDQKKGSIALQQLKRKHNVASSSEHGFEDQQQLLELESSVARLTDSLKVQEEVLDNARALYRHQLKSENPVLFRFEQLDIPYLTSTIASVFNRVELISKSYYSLVQIMDDLAYDYNKKLNDKVVNDNVGKYIDFMNNHSEDINVSPSLDSDQRVKIEEYLSLELPEMFRKGTSKVPLLAIKGKFAMVDAIMKVKMKYKDDLVAFMKVLVELMDDISTNYNVNFQDSGVRKAVAAYGDFLGEYANIFDPLEFPKKFHEEFERLGQFIAEEAPAIAAPSAEANDSILSQIKEFFNYHWQVIRQDPSSIGAQQSRIDTMESKCLSSREALRVERQELQRLTNQIKNTDSTADSMDLEEIGELLQNMNPGCINVAYDNYLYQICFNSEEGRIVQKEDKPDGNTVLIGRFDSFQFDHEVSSQRYIDGIRNQYSDSDLMSHLESEEGPNDAKLLMGNLPDINSGLVIHYNGGARCWNGPARSAQVSFKCSEAFQIRNVYEPTRCHYVFEISGPLGCPSRFNFERPEWL